MVAAKAGLERELPQRALLAWERTVPANAFVASLYFGLWRTLEALLSIAALVCFPVPAWASADAARLLAVADALGLFSVAAALEAIFGEVCFVFSAMKALLWLYKASGNCLRRGQDSGYTYFRYFCYFT